MPCLAPVALPFKIPVPLGALLVKNEDRVAWVFFSVVAALPLEDDELLGVRGSTTLVLLDRWLGDEGGVGEDRVERWDFAPSSSSLSESNAACCCCGRLRGLCLTGVTSSATSSRFRFMGESSPMRRPGIGLSVSF